MSYDIEAWENIPDNIEDYRGFVYRITGPDGRMYIGKKSFWFKNNKKLARKPTKAEITRLQKYAIENKKKNNVFKKKLKDKYKGLKKTVKGFKESDWKSYYGSSPELLAEVERLGKDMFRREILILCKTLWDMSYYEAKMQFDENVLFDEKYYNGIINCRLRARKGKR